MSLSFWLLLGLTACDDVIAPAPQDVHAFVDAEALPTVRDVRQVFALDDMRVYTIRYGEPQDCHSGCFYLGGVLLKLGTKLGWIDLDAPQVVFDAERRVYVPDTTGYTFFPLTASDTALFTARLFDVFAASQSDTYNSYRAYLALNGHTPEFALFRIAARLPREGTPHIAWLVVTHPESQCSRRTLEPMVDVLAPAAAYSEVRTRARDLLTTFAQRCA